MAGLAHWLCGTFYSDAQRAFLDSTAFWLIAYAHAHDFILVSQERATVNFKEKKYQNCTCLQ